MWKTLLNCDYRQMCCSVLKQHELTTAFSCHNSHIVKQIIKRVVEQWGVRFMHLIQNWKKKMCLCSTCTQLSLVLWQHIKDWWKWWPCSFHNFNHDNAIIITECFSYLTLTTQCVKDIVWHLVHYTYGEDPNNSHICWSNGQIWERDLYSLYNSRPAGE